MLRRFTFTTVLIVLLTAVGLAPLAVFGLAVVRVVSDHLVHKTIGELKEDVLSDAHHIRHRVESAQGDVPIISHVAAMRELIQARTLLDLTGIEQWRKALEQVFLSFSANRTVYNQIRYLDENGQELVRVDNDGVNPPRIIPRDRLQNQRQRYYFSETMKLGPGQLFTSQPEFNQEHGRIEVPYRPVIRYATPLFDDEGNRRGIVIINLLIGPLLEALHQEGKAVGKVVYVVDREGFYLLHPDPAKRWGSPRDLNTGRRLQQDFPDLAGRLLAGDPVAAILGEQIITAQSFAIGPSASDPSLVIIELMPTRMVLAPVAALRWYLLILLAGVGSVAVVGAVVIGRRFARPIVALEQASHRIQQGHLDARVKVGGSAEIAALGDAFNNMADNVVTSLQETRESEQRFRSLIETAQDGVVIADRHGRITLVNRAAEKIFGYCEQEMLGQFVSSLMPDRYQEDCRQGFDRYLRIRDAGVIGRSLEFSGLRKSGEEFPLEISLSVAEQHGSEFFTAIIRDVTERKKREAQLIESEKLATMGTMAAGVAHDFNNALMGVLGQTQLMRLSLEQGSVAADLRSVEVYTTLLERLSRQEQVALDAAETIRKIREATRPRGAEAFGPVALNRIVEQVLAITRPRWKDQAEAAGVHIAVQTALADTPPVQGNAAELREALTNLLFNALDAMPNGGTITVSTIHARSTESEVQNPPTPPLQKGGAGGFGVREAEREGQGWVELAVADTGTGMSQVVQTRLFEPFFTTKGVRGTGLGLSMVYGIIERHGGEISVRSVEGQGTTITVRVPVAEVEAAGERGTEMVSLPDAPRRSPLTGPLTLLVIDDDPLLAETLSVSLRLLGHEATVATSGKEGLTRLTTERFDLVLTDLGMAEMSGWEVAKAVKARWPTCPVILVTGWGDALESDRLEGTGVDLVLAKPYTMAQLQDALAEAVAIIRRSGGTRLDSPVSSTGQACHARNDEPE
ncbi:MAG: PAS domain S-box protein [Candidatus Methylomirabilis oxygeniifera]|uniref:histidine kinase n=1 Tax=Methylomirabilis oxygeniifera TaxID=671143 RepID=D5MG97_METO1|nr:MAG: PAS domain S-box protein [Candidatus Methylomirabilis oxyfera]CBE68778.1 putative Histidine kinase [Candidatus Methylomirabilis oxyfera]